MKIGTCEITAEEIIAALASEKTLLLATAADDRVTTRLMSYVNNGLTVYFQTGNDSLKARHMIRNPRVALHVGGYDMEGEATLSGHPLAAENSWFAERYKEKYPQYAEIWSADPDEIVVKVKIGLVRHWRYIDGKPFIAEGRFEELGEESL